MWRATVVLPASAAVCLTRGVALAVPYLCLRFVVRVTAWNKAGLEATAMSPLVTVDTRPPLLGLVAAGSPSAVLAVAEDLGDELSNLSTCRCAAAHARFDLLSGSCQCINGRYFDAAAGKCVSCASDSTHAECTPRAARFTWPANAPTCPPCANGMWRPVPAQPYSGDCPSCRSCAATLPPVYLSAASFGGEVGFDVSWAGFVGDMAPVASYTVSLGTSAFGTGFLSERLVVAPGDATTALSTTTSFVPAHGDVIYATVVATSATGLHSVTSVSVAEVDATAPAPGIVSTVGAGAGVTAPVVHASTQPDATLIRVHATPFEDATSGIAAVLAGVFSAPCEQQLPNTAIVPLTPQPDVVLPGIMELALEVPAQHGDTLFSCVAAVNGAGLQTLASAPVTVVDLLPPSPAAVLDGPAAGHDLDCAVWDGRETGTSAGAALAVTWDRFHDATSGVVSVDVALGSASGESDVLAWTAVDASSTSFTLHNVSSVASSLPESSTPLFWSVRATDGVGQFTTVSSDGVVMWCLGLVGDAYTQCRADIARDDAQRGGPTSCVALGMSQVVFSDPSADDGLGEADFGTSMEMFDGTAAGFAPAPASQPQP